MAKYDVLFYDFDPWSVFKRTVGGTTTYSGSQYTTGTATITDNGTGVYDESLEDNTEGETATADINVNGISTTGIDVSAEEVWTLRDTVTGETFQLVTFHVGSGANAGYYTLSERPLVPGRTYETVEFDSAPSVDAGDPVFTYADFAGYPDGIVEGTAGDDVIDTNYTGDPEGDRIDANDLPGTTTEARSFNWSQYADGTDLRGGVVQDTGGINVAVSYSNADPNQILEADTSTSNYSAGGEPFANTSSGFLFQNGTADDATVTFDFSAVSGSGFADDVQNVSFRINDIDGVINTANNFQDIVSVYAYDSDGNAVPVVITIAGNDSLNDAGDTVTAAITSDSAASANGSVLVEVAGPVSQIVIVYDNGGDTQQAINITDVHFIALTPSSGNEDLVYAGDGDDFVDSGTADDEVYGEAGNDTLTIGGGDTAIGGDGDDTFIIDPTLLNGTGFTVSGGEGGETNGDTLDFNGQLQKGSIVYINSDDAAGGLSGTAVLLDGTIIKFEEIETIICFTAGTLIETAFGPRPVESLQPGDLVRTRDRGLQPFRWTGARHLLARPEMAPITFAPGSIGNTAAISVSPQHRMLIRDARTQLYFGEEEVLVAAKHLVNGRDVTQGGAQEVTYHHILFDQHEIVFANGVQTESYHPGATSLPGLDPRARAKLFDLFPNLRADPVAYGPAARVSVCGQHGRLLAA